MKKLAVVALLSVSVTTTAYAMEIKDYPRNLEELKYCITAQMDKDIPVPYGCKTLLQRVAEKVLSK